MNDKFIENEDLDLLINNITMSHKPPTGKRKLSDWVKEHKDTIGKEYISSTARYYDNKK